MLMMMLVIVLMMMLMMMLMFVMMMPTTVFVTMISHIILHLYFAFCVQRYEKGYATWLQK